MDIRIYTRQGDTGETGLLGNRRVRKDDVLVEAIGTVDELNSMLGWVAAAYSEVPEWLREVQVDLFDLGAELAAKDWAAPGIPTISEAHIARLEAMIDDWESNLPPLRHFILPGGSELASRLHVCRSVARRAERSIVRLDQVRPPVLRYMNRLSDLLFIAARVANQEQGISDVPYRGKDSK